MLQWCSIKQIVCLQNDKKRQDILVVIFVPRFIFLNMFRGRPPNIHSRNQKNSFFFNCAIAKVTLKTLFFSKTGERWKKIQLHLKLLIEILILTIFSVKLSEKIEIHSVLQFKLICIKKTFWWYFNNPFYQFFQWESLPTFKTL